jgi:hypothetical protein
MCEGFICDVQWYLHVGAYYPYSGILQFVLWYMCGDTWMPTLTMSAKMLRPSVVLQEFTPRCFLYAKALYVNVHNIRCSTYKRNTSPITT